MSYEDMMDEHAALAHEISNRDLHVEELEKRIEELEAENKRLLDQLERTQGYEAGFVENLKILECDNEVQAKRIKLLEIRMRTMRDWALSVHGIDIAHKSDWFDEDGVPR